MAFPNLVLKTGGVLTSTATGVPVNGNNTFLLNIPTKNIDSTNWLKLNIFALGPSVTGATFVSLSPDNTSVTVNFVQTGADQCKVEAVLVHSTIR